MDAGDTCSGSGSNSTADPDLVITPTLRDNPLQRLLPPQARAEGPRGRRRALQNYDSKLSTVSRSDPPFCICMGTQTPVLLRISCKFESGFFMENYKQQKKLYPQFSLFQIEILVFDGGSTSLRLGIFVKKS